MKVFKLGNDISRVALGRFGWPLCIGDKVDRNRKKRRPGELDGD